MARCILHIGMHKTGTTSIQNTLFDYEDRNFYFARLGGDANHSVPMYSIFSDAPEKHYLNRNRLMNGFLDDYLKKIRSDLKRSIDEAGERSLIISGEDIAFLPEAAIGRIAEYLSRHCTSTQVLAYVRAPMSYMNSAFQQMVRSGRRTTLNLPGLYRNYRDSFEKFDTHFGRENVLLKPFEQKELAGGDSVLDFCATIGLELKPGRIKRSNESSSKEFISLIYQYNHYCKNEEFEHLTGSESHHLNGVLKDLGRSKFSFAPELLKAVVEKNSSDVEWMSERLGRSTLDRAAEAADSDVKSEKDLLAPIPGAREVLLRSLRRPRLNAAELEGLSDIELFHKLRELARNAPVNRVKPQGKDKLRADAPGAGGEARKRLKAAAGTAQGVAGPRLGPGDEPARATSNPATAEAQGRPDAEPGHQSAKLAADKRSRLMQNIEQSLGPRPWPLINVDKNFMVYWSPKSACTTTYVWFAHASGFADQIREFGTKIHKHRAVRFYQSNLFERGASSDLSRLHRLRIILDPYDRAVGIYRHALKSGSADEQMETLMGSHVNAARGFSFQQFLDFIEKCGVRNAEGFIRPQFCALEKKYPPTRVLNVSKSDMFAGLNAFEAEAGLTPTNFAELTWLQELEDKRKAEVAVIEGEAKDETAFTQRDVKELNEFPSSGQLLTPAARARIEVLYKDDFEAYRDYL